MAKKTERYKNGPLYEDEFKVYEDSDGEFEFRAYRNKCKENGSMGSTKQRVKKSFDDLDQSYDLDESQITETIAIYEQMILKAVVEEYFDYCNGTLDGRDLQGEDVSELEFDEFFEIYHVDERCRVYVDFCRSNPGVSSIIS